jgi:hypothetical protein
MMNMIRDSKENPNATGIKTIRNGRMNLMKLVIFISGYNNQ